MSTFIENEPITHELYDLLKDILGFTYPMLRWELRQRGHAVSAPRLSLMLRGYEPIPSDLEIALNCIAAGEIEGRPVLPEKADAIVGRFFQELAEESLAQEKSVSAIDRFGDFVDALDDPEKIERLAWEVCR